MPNNPDAHTIARMLASRTDTLVRELLPRGRRDGNTWRVGSIAGEPGQSLCVRLAGDRAGLWYDHNGGVDAGDALDLVAATLFRGDLAAAITWSKRWLGLADGAVPPPQPRQAPAPDATDEADAERRGRHARALWLAGRPLPGTAAENYFFGRDIALAELARPPRALRFHPSCWCAEVAAALPAIVAAVVAADGTHVATHRTWLAKLDGVWRKAPLSSPRKSIGTIRGAVIPLQRGASGKSLRDALASDTVVLTEGIETGLSVAVSCPEFRVLAAISVSNLVAVGLPAQIRDIIIAAENDPPGSPAAAAVQLAIDRFCSEGRRVRIARSWIGSDLNDLLTATE